MCRVSKKFFPCQEGYQSFLCLRQLSEYSSETIQLLLPSKMTTVAILACHCFVFLSSCVSELRAQFEDDPVLLVVISILIR